MGGSTRTLVPVVLLLAVCATVHGQAPARAGGLLGEEMHTPTGGASAADPASSAPGERRPIADSAGKREPGPSPEMSDPWAPPPTLHANVIATLTAEEKDDYKRLSLRAKAQWRALLEEKSSGRWDSLLWKLSHPFTSTEEYYRTMRNEIIYRDDMRKMAAAESLSRPDWAE